MRVLSSPTYSNDLLVNRDWLVTFRLSKYSTSSPCCLEPMAFREYGFLSAGEVALVMKIIARLLLGAFLDAWLSYKSTTSSECWNLATLPDMSIVAITCVALDICKVVLTVLLSLSTEVKLAVLFTYRIHIELAAVILKECGHKHWCVFCNSQLVDFLNFRHIQIQSCSFSERFELCSIFR